METQLAEQLLSNLVVLLPQLSTVDEHDKRMQGKLELILQLIHVLGNRGLASTDSHQLVHLLLTGQPATLLLSDHVCVFICLSTSTYGMPSGTDYPDYPKPSCCSIMHFMHTYVDLVTPHNLTDLCLYQIYLQLNIAVVATSLPVTSHLRC